MTKTTSSRPSYRHHPQDVPCTRFISRSRGPLRTSGERRVTRFQSAIRERTPRARAHRNSSGTADETSVFRTKEEDERGRTIDLWFLSLSLIIHRRIPERMEEAQRVIDRRSGGIDQPRIAASLPGVFRSRIPRAGDIDMNRDYRPAEVNESCVPVFRCGSAHLLSAPRDPPA